LAYQLSKALFRFSALK